MDKVDVFKIDSEDLGDIISQIEVSFKIEFNENEIQNLMSIDELADMVISKVGYKEGFECSSQIVFYRLRQLLTKKTSFNKESLGVNTDLEKIFPSRGRREKWKATFNRCSLDVPNLEAHSFSLITILIAFISFFFIFGRFYIYALPLFLTSIYVTYLLFKYANKLPCKTLGDLSKHIVKYDYLKSRNNVKTINIKEVKRIILSHIADWLGGSEIKSISMNTKIDYISK